MINLNKGKNEELLSKCKPLSDYMTLINKINHYNESAATIEQAVERAIEECIEENVLADFLQKHKGDVMSTCLTEFDEKAFRKGCRVEEATENAKNLFKNGVSYELVRKSIITISEEELQQIYDTVMAEKP